MSTYDLRAEVHAILTDTSLTDPGDVADKIVESMPGNALRSSLRVTMRAYVREVMRGQRPQSPQSTGSGQPRYANRHISSAAAGSAKVRGIREGWRARRVFAGEWKLLAECSHADVMRLAEERRTVAAQNEVWADRYERLAEEMKRARVAVAGDLPDTIACGILTGAAE